MVRALACELSQVRRELRDELLAELPDEQRAVIASLLAEIEAHLGRSTSEPRHFEQHLCRAEVQGSQPLLQLNEGQVRLLLGAEHPAVQQHIAASVRRSQLNEFGPAVAQAIFGHLTRRLESNGIGGAADAQRPRRFWRRLLRAER